ncbi:MAG: hypothetical protein Q7S42_05850 [Candidatus Omnitrophota bacterium]|nr:hypothetical protein [Candidatus Omnitrophota bacterium]
MSQFVWTSSFGCLLPCLIVFNLLFGKPIFGSTRLWLGIEGVLILIFMLKIHILADRISKQFGQQVRGSATGSQNHRRKPKGEVIDIQGHIVEDKK